MGYGRPLSVHFLNVLSKPVEWSLRIAQNGGQIQIIESFQFVVKTLNCAILLRILVTPTKVSIVSNFVCL